MVGRERWAEKLSGGPTVESRYLEEDAATVRMLVLMRAARRAAGSGAKRADVVRRRCRGER